MCVCVYVCVCVRGVCGGHMHMRIGFYLVHNLYYLLHWNARARARGCVCITVSVYVYMCVTVVNWILFHMPIYYLP